MTDPIIINRTSISDDVYQVIKKMIQQRKLKPGDQVKLRDIANIIEVSLTPIQNALHKLEIEGLVKSTPHRGTVVVGLSKNDVCDLLDIRMFIEVFASKSAVRSPHLSKHGEKLREIVAKMESLISGDDYSDFEKFVSLDTKLHRSLVELSDSKMLLDFYDYIEARMHIIRIFYSKSTVARRVHEIAGEHRSIIDALQNADSKRLSTAIKNHITNTRKAVLKGGDVSEYL